MKYVISALLLACFLSRAALASDLPSDIPLEDIPLEDIQNISLEEMLSGDSFEPLLSRTESIIQMVVRDYLLAEEASGSVWAVSMEDLSTGDTGEYRPAEIMQSASVIKVFIMGAVFDRILAPASEDKRIACQGISEGDLDSLLTDMITVSSNEAANRLVEILGEGDFEKGAQTVNAYCQENDYRRTSLGRRFMASNPQGDNYTSAGDCRLFLSRVYNGRREGDESCAKMMDYLMGQTVRHKIPSGLPEGWSCANKTGEMPEGYGLGCIENDIAVIFSPTEDYVLTILSNNL